MKRNNKGYVLIEVVAAIVISAVALTVIMQSLASGYRAAVFNQEYTKALILLENRFNQTALGSVPQSNFIEEKCPAPWTRFKCLTKVIARQGSAGSKISKVDVAVAWESGDKIKEISLPTFLLEPAK